MADDQINIKIKQTNNNQTFDVSIFKENTVLELKKACADKSGLSESQQNLVYKGRILSDEKLVGDYNIAEGHTIIMVKKVSQDEKDKSKTTEPTTTTNTLPGTGSVNPNPMFGQGGLGDFGGMGLGGGNMGGMDLNSALNMMNNPMYMQMMNSVNKLNFNCELCFLN